MINTKYLICYSFTFNVCVCSKSGKIYRNHKVRAIGISYNLALWDMEDKLKRRGMTINNIIAVTVDRIEFAVDEKGMPIYLSLSKYMPCIPEDLNRGTG